VTKCKQKIGNILYSITELKN